ncbi:iron complex transport system substrate-binding protein [Hungatella effluvii]|uniref:Iron complex transport system substrate-binding protein n=1 Tax=Hungatella effluvii TaxID=1096246 RepID=A0A2V3XZM4_9FIRM|nr:ABC transporter substrate-binding protein [Hungatella effluvii]PXX50721.1 iron complex transport system substrate-binding protein [Hungatella effluvii]
MKKRKNIWLGLSLAAIMMMGLGGCAKGSGNTGEAQQTAVETTAAATADTTAEASQETDKADSAAGDKAAQAEGTRIITDSAGREVEIPSEITKIAPSGPLAQIVLYTVSPDKLAGLAADFSDEAKQYIDEKYWGLPKFGQFYGKNASLNMEALIAEAPDVIIDIGEAKKTVKEDMDALQEQLNIPVIFVEATLPTMADAYEMLGDITGEKAQAGKLADYCRAEIGKADQNAAAIADADRKSVYFGLGDDGLHTNAKGSIHADVIDRIGAVNAADVEAVSSGGGSEVSFEQVLLWNPDLIIVDSQKLYDTLTADPMWQELDAVKNGKIFKIPTAPYSYMSSPPSVNRMIGIEWLGGLVYPEIYTSDIREEVKNFYQLFYHIDVTDEKLEAILKNAVRG